MTSTNFNIGLGDNSRTSSRVLRPPGGGHTDIFTGAEPQQLRRDNGRNASSILEGTNGNTVPSSPVKPVPTPAPPKQNVTSEPAVSQQTQRSRVPPGGFSSGLW